MQIGGILSHNLSEAVKQAFRRNYQEIKEPIKACKVEKEPKTAPDTSVSIDDISPFGGIPAKIEYNNCKGVFVVNSEIKSEWYSSSKRFIPYTDKRFIWPVPLNDILRNPSLASQQNAGWE